MSLCRVPCVRVPRFCSELHTNCPPCCLRVSAFPVSDLNFTPTAEGTRQHEPARTGTDRHAQAARAA
eukprot:2413631-Prymnesium_polylepis.1